VGDSDQRTLTLGELVDAYNAGVVTQETFIWCDGMDDWRPLAEVETVVTALHASAGQIALGTPGAFEPQAAAATYEAAYEPQAAAAYEASPSYPAPAAEPKRAAVAKREARARDLFATNAGEELHTSAPAIPEAMASAGGDAAGLTGQRNENSVLFSLAVLTQNAEAHSSQEPPTANKEDSGLIDLKALAQKADSMRPMAMGDGNVFHAPLGLTPPLGAPVGALGSSGPDVPARSKLPLYIGAGAGVLVLLVLCIFIGVKIGGAGSTPVATAAPVATTTATATAEPSVTAAAATAEASASAAASASVATAGQKKPGPGNWKPGPPGATPVLKPAGGSGGAAPTPTGASPTPKKGGGDCGCNGDLMCLMKCSTH
jgi:hypothetical protein